MALLLSQLTPVVETGPTGTGVNCLEFADYLEEILLDENSWFYSYEDLVEGIGGYYFDVDIQEDSIEEPSSWFFLSEDSGPLDTGINYYYFDVDVLEEPIEESSSWFYEIEEYDNGPAGTGVFCLEYEVYLDNETTDENSYFFVTPDDFIPPVTSAVFLRQSRIYYAT